MKVLDDSLVREWLKIRSLLDPRGDVDLSSLGRSVRMVVPKDAGRRTNLGRLLAELFDSRKEGLVWVREFGIWPSSENQLIFSGLRSLMGDDRDLREAPGHTFDKSDADLLSALLAIILYFSWGAVVVRGDGNLIARVSHDEYIEFHGIAEDLGAAEERLKAQGYL